MYGSAMIDGDTMTSVITKGTAYTAIITKLK